MNSKLTPQNSKLFLSILSGLKISVYSSRCIGIRGSTSLICENPRNPRLPFFAKQTQFQTEQNNVKRLKSKDFCLLSMA